MPSIGETLREERIKRGINVKDLERITRIRSKYLLAIEKNDFSVLPGTIYARSFIKSYAKALGIDHIPFIEEFTRVYQGTRNDPEHVASSSSNTRTITPSMNRRLGYSTTRPIKKRSNLAVVLVSLALLVLFIFFYTAIKSLWAPENAIKGENKKVESKKNNVGSTGNKTNKVTTSNEIPIKQSPIGSNFTVKIVKPGAWVRIVVDGKKSYEGILTAGSSKTFTGSKLRIRTGNAGAVYVWIEGRRIGKLGGANEIVEKTFSN